MNHKIEKMLEPGSRIGILGGGQLGRMLAIAAARLGFKSHIFDPSENAPASQVRSLASAAPPPAPAVPRGLQSRVFDESTTEFRDKTGSAAPPRHRRE